MIKNPTYVHDFNLVIPLLVIYAIHLIVVYDEKKIEKGTILQNRNLLLIYDLLT